MCCPVTSSYCFGDRRPSSSVPSLVTSILSSSLRLWYLASDKMATRFFNLTSIYYLFFQPIRCESHFDLLCFNLVINELCLAISWNNFGGRIAELISTTSSNKVGASLVLTYRRSIVRLIDLGVMMATAVDMLLLYALYWCLNSVCCDGIDCWLLVCWLFAKSCLLNQLAMIVDLSLKTSKSLKMFN